MTTEERRQRAVITWVGREHARGRLEADAEDLVSKLAYVFAGDRELGRRMLLDLHRLSLVRAVWKTRGGVYLSRGMTVDQMIEKDPRYAALTIEGVQLTTEGRRLFAEMQRSPLDRLIRWLEPRQVVLGITTAIGGALALAIARACGLGQ